MTGDRYVDWEDVPLACTIDDVRRVLGISRETVYRLLRSGELKSRKVGVRRRVVPKWALMEYVGEEANR